VGGATIGDMTAEAGERPSLSDHVRTLATDTIRRLRGDEVFGHSTDGNPDAWRELDAEVIVDAVTPIIVAAGRHATPGLADLQIALAGPVTTAAHNDGAGHHHVEGFCRACADVYLGLCLTLGALDEAGYRIVRAAPVDDRSSQAGTGRS
jgi:hypothetical protein